MLSFSDLRIEQDERFGGDLHTPLNGLRLYRKAGPGEIVGQGAHILKRAHAEYKKLN
jgi:hypothetical protein